MRILLFFVFMTSALSGFSQDWLTDFKQATQLAQKEDHNILLVFQGSDWCAPCIKLDREIWTSQVFKDYAKEHYVLLKADFPKRKQNRLSEEQQAHNDKLAEMYNRQGFFPLVVVMTPQGEVLGETGYHHVSPDEYIGMLESFVSLKP